MIGARHKQDAAVEAPDAPLCSARPDRHPVRSTKSHNAKLLYAPTAVYREPVRAPLAGVTAKEKGARAGGRESHQTVSE